jgi:hypothetical protein
MTPFDRIDRMLLALAICVGACVMIGCAGQASQPAQPASAAPASSASLRGALVRHAIDPLMLELQAQASAGQYQAIANAIHASPMLAAQLDGLVQTRLLTRIRVGEKPSGPAPVAAPGSPAAPRFGAWRDGTEWILSAGFIASQAPQRYFDVIHPDDILPDNMVFALGYLAYKTQSEMSLRASLRAAARNRGTHRPYPDELRSTWIALHLRDDAGAFIQAWNDVEDAALQVNRQQPLSVTQSGALLLNLRYRGPVLKALQQSSPNHLFIGPRGIDPTQHNLDAMSLALQSSTVIDIEP